MDGTAFYPDPAHKLSTNLYDIYHCSVYIEKLLMMDRGTVRNMCSFIPKNNFERLVHPVGFIIREGGFDVAVSTCNRKVSEQDVIPEKRLSICAFH